MNISEGTRYKKKKKRFAVVQYASNGNRTY